MPSSKVLKSVAEVVQEAIKKADKAPTKGASKASEALGKMEGKTLMVTESDRTKVGQGYLGGPGFSSLQLTDPAYRDVGAVWGVATPSKASTILGASRRVPEGEHVFTTMVGSPTQHRSNQQVFNKLLDEFRASAREGNLSEELQGRINDSLRSAINKEGKPIFAPNVDIMSPKFRKQANTFERRAVAADLIAGQGIGGKKGQIIDFEKIIRRTTDPLLVDVETGSMGPRLFTLSGKTLQRPDLHPAFPSILTGEDLGVAFEPAPIELMFRDYVRNLMETKGRKPGYMDITRGHGPKQFISEDLLTEMQKAGFAEGGNVTSNPDVTDSGRIDLNAQYEMSKGGAAIMKRGGKAKGETLASMDTGKVETRQAPGEKKAVEAIQTAAETVVPFLSAGKSAIEGEYQKALIEAGLDVAGGPLAKGLGAAIPAVAGIFIGSNARLWDKAAAKEFKKLEKAGVSNEEAFKQTGTFRSPDGELRQEISDRPARLKGEKLRDISGALQLNVDAPQKAKLEKMYADIFDQMKSSGTDAPLSQLIYHPELFKAYPELESLRGRYNIIPSMPETGYYNLGSPTTPPRLGAEGPTPESARSSMLHEIQHAIQHLEGFGMGGNPEMGMTMLPRSMDAVDYLNQLRKSKMNLLDEQARLAKEFKESGAQYTLDNPLVQKSIELPNKIDDVDQAIEGIVQGYFYPMYKRMAGEAESRAVQARRQMSPQELRDVFPLSSYDVPVDQLIVKRVPPYANGGAVMMADGGGLEEEYNLRKMGMDPTRVRGGYERKPLSREEIQAMMLDVPAGIGVPFAEAGSYALRGKTDEAKESAAIEAALIGVPGAAVLAKPAYQAVKKGVKKAAPAARDLAREFLESGMESGLIQSPSYVVKPSGGQWLGGHRGDTRQIDVSNAPAAVSAQALEAHQEMLGRAKQRAQEYTEMSGFEPTQEMTDRVRGFQSDVDRIVQGNAIRNWVDSNLNNYVRKQMGTPDDPVLKLAEQGILHMPYQETGLLRGLAAQREKAGFPAEGLATTDLGRMWETMSDRNIASIEAGKLTDPNYLKDLERRAKENDPLFNARPGRINDEPPPAVMTPEEARDLQRFKYMNYPPARANAMEENQWLSRVDPETPIYSLSDPFGGRVSGEDLGFDHIVDVLKADLAAGRIRPEQLSKMSMEQAVRRTHEYDLERAAAMAKAAEEEMAGLSVAKSFDDGFKIVQLNKPGQFAKESDRMGHSVRGYEPSRGSEDWIEDAGEEGSRHYGHGGWDAIKSGEAQVFSIRDAKNNPHVTIEVAGPRYPGDNPVEAFNSLGKPYKEAKQEAAERIGLPEGRFPADMSAEQRNEMQAKFEQAMHDIFAENGGKLQRRITQIKGKQNRKPDENYLPYVQQFIREGNFEIAGDLRNSGLIDLQSGQRPAFVPTDAPRYVTQAELDHMQRTGKFEPDFKKGGAVVMRRGGKMKKQSLEEMFHAKGRKALMDFENATKKRKG